MSGLQASITTQIASQFYSPESGWHANHTLFSAAVGNHPTRLHNLYFTFFFLVRAVVRAGELLLLRPLEGVEDPELRAEHQAATELVRALVRAELPGAESESARRCHDAFDESVLFQVAQTAGNDSSPRSHHQYWEELYEKQQLREDFRNK